MAAHALETRRDLALRAEEACLNGWPALATVLLDGWQLRFAEGHTKRSNAISVLAPSQSTDTLAERIRACEALYAARGLPAIFRLSTAAPQPGLAEALDAAGYGPPADETRVLVAETLPREIAPGAPATVVAGPPEQSWLDAAARILVFGTRAADLNGRILAALGVPAAFASVEASDGTTGAVAFGAVHDGLVCMNRVATAAEHRGRGLAGQAVGAVMAWAATEAGAEGACLPVGAGNAPALSLYRRLGFAREVSRYHYRIAPPA